MENVFYALKLALVGGLLSLDATAAFQVMVSQPLPACALLGVLTGHPGAGFAVGAAFQLLFLSDLPVGSHVPKEGGLVSVAALGAALVFDLGNPLDIRSLSASAVLAVAAEPLFRLTSRWVRRLNAVWTPPVERLLRGGRTGAALVVAQGGLLFFFLRGFAIVFGFALGAGLVLDFTWEYLPPQVLRACHWTFVLFPLAGAAHFLAAFMTGRLGKADALAGLLARFVPGRRSA